MKWLRAEATRSVLRTNPLAASLNSSNNHDHRVTVLSLIMIHRENTEFGFTASLVAQPIAWNFSSHAERISLSARSYVRITHDQALSKKVNTYQSSLCRRLPQRPPLRRVKRRARNEAMISRPPVGSSRCPESLDATGSIITFRPPCH